jgi:hypothetical protein
MFFSLPLLLYADRRNAPSGIGGFDQPLYTTLLTAVF